MKTLLLLTLLALAAAPARAASDADVTLIKTHKVTIDPDLITIVAEATTRLVTLSGDHNPDHKGQTFMGRPSNWTTIKSDRATFIIQRPSSARKGGPVESAWEMSLKAAKDLQEGKPVGRIGYYTPEIIIRKNLITSIEGPAFLYDKGK